MIFRPEIAKRISAGKKTMARRPAKDERDCRYKPGRAYQVQAGHGKPGLFTITIQSVRLELLGDISLKDVKREGFITTQEFIDAWIEVHGKYDPERPVWVISFAVGDRTDTPTLLAARPGLPHGDYVGQSFLAMANEPEAVTPSQLARITATARTADRSRATDPLQSQRNQIARSLADMRSHLKTEPNRDISRTVRALEHQLASLDRKLKAA